MLKKIFRKTVKDGGKVMKSSKILFALLVAGILIGFGLPIAQAAEGQASSNKIDCVPMSNTEFANAVVMAMGIEMPEGSGNLPKAELFEVQSNILAERGIDLFANADANKTVTKADLCKVLQALNNQVDQATNTSPGRSSVTNPFYDPISGYAKTPPEELAAYLEQFGCTTIPEGQETVCANEIISALNNPAYSKTIAEAYSDPKGIGRPPLIVPPQNPTPEDDVTLSEETPASLT
jgi:hypothetical protein